MVETNTSTNERTESRLDNLLTELNRASTEDAPALIKQVGAEIHQYRVLLAHFEKRTHFEEELNGLLNERDNPEFSPEALKNHKFLSHVRRIFSECPEIMRRYGAMLTTYLHEAGASKEELAKYLALR